MRQLAVCLALVCSALTAAAASHPGDAAVRSIQFVDEREGWAVGDDGAIWHSIDGGQAWERQASGTHAALRAVHFLTPYSGWAVGRSELPGGESHGIVLTTTDGGLKWSPATEQTLPGLNCVRFFSQRNGVAAGDGSDLYPTGIFATTDGGRTWRPVPGKRCPAWLAADFADADTGALGGPWSALATYRDGYFGAAQTDSLEGRSVKSLRINGKFAVAVGQGGLILTSRDSAGLKWGFAVPNLPKEVLAACDFEAVAIHDKHLWVAGRPGSFVLHSPDLGKTWEIHKTGQPLPLHALHFINENVGWAAGELGTLLATKDGGKTWKVARQDAQRAAALFVHAAAGSAPFDVVTLLGEDEGYHAVVLSATCAAAPVTPARRAEDDRPLPRKIEPTGAPPRAALLPEKLSAAMRRVGGTAGESLWQFPLPNQHDGCTGEQLLASWDRLHGDRSSAELLRQMVLAIRIWRPEVIVCDEARQNGDPAALLVVAAVKEAFKVAADPDMFPEQLATLKLTAWSPKKLFALAEKPDPASVKLAVDEIKTRLGDCARDFAQPAELLIADQPAPHAGRSCQLLSTRLTEAVGDSHLFAGINLAYGGQARRELTTVDEESIKARPIIEKAIQKRRTLEALVRGEGGDLAKPEQVLAQLGPAIKEMPDEHGCRAIFALANHYAKSGQWVFAREAFLLMAEKYPAHPLTLEAYRWLVRYQCSSEARRRQELGHFVNVIETEVRPLPGRLDYVDPFAPPADKKSKKPNTSTGGTEIVRSGHTIPLSEFEDARQWFKGGLAIEPKLGVLGPTYADDPAMQLCFQSAHRQLGETDPPKKWFSRYLAAGAAPLGSQTVVRGADPWRDCAMAELWLINKTVGVSPPKPLAYCSRTETKPHLDGKLDDPCWDGVRPLVLSTVAGELELAVVKDEQGKLASEYSTRAWFTFDSEYLYVAVQCTHPKGKRVPPVEKRSRDMDLRGFDRVSIMLDLDRDYQTYFHLQIDQRGCLAEDCWGDSSWNPQWFVAIASDETSWTAEAAIPLKELTGHAPTPGQVWAANVTRIVPGQGVQAWSTPADAKPRPEGMGLLQFIQAGKK
jgi:photosystem II stability/assembly factor-like uncharacterized protein